MNRVAVLLSGAPRTILDCVEGIRKAWEAPDYKVVYFIVLWNNDLNKEWEDEIINSFPDCSYLFAPNRGFVAEGNAVIHLPTDMYDFRNIFRQAYGIRLANNLRIGWEKKTKQKFDIVARMRPDEVHEKHIGIKKKDIKPKTLIIPDHSHCSGYNDHLAIGSGATMNIFVKHFDWLLEKLHNLHINNPYPPYKGPRLRRNRNLLPYLTPEYLLERYLKIDTDLKIVQLPIIYKTVRSCFVGKKFSEIPLMSCQHRDVGRWL